MGKNKAVTVHSIVKKINKEAKQVKKQRISDYKAQIKKAKEDRLSHAVDLGNVDFHADTKKYCIVINGEEETFSSRRELKRTIRKKYKGQKDNGEKVSQTSNLLLIAFGYLFLVIGAFSFGFTEEGIQISKLDVFAAFVFPLYIYILCVMIKSAISNKLVLLPENKKYIEKEVKLSRAGITASFFLFTAITTIIAELTKKLINSIIDNGANVKFNNILRGILLGAGILFFVLAFFIDKILNLFTWLSSFVKFSKIETEDKPAENKLEENKPAEPRERKDPTP